MLDVRLQKKTITSWQNRLASLSDQAVLADRLASSFAESHLRRALTRWRNHLFEYSKDEVRASELYAANEQKRVSQAFDIWRARSNRIQENKDRADKARAFFSSRTAVRIWKERTRARMQARAVKKRKMEDLRLYFDGTIFSSLHLWT